MTGHHRGNIMAKERYPGERKAWRPEIPSLKIGEKNDYTRVFMYPPVEAVHRITDLVDFFIWDAMYNFDS